MEYNNKMIDLAKRQDGIDKETLETAVTLLAPFAPHIAEELWEQLGHSETVFAHGWPDADEEAMKDDEIEIAVQVNGKVRGTVRLSTSISKEDALAAGKAAVPEWLKGTIVKEVYVPGRILNFVVK